MFKKFTEDSVRSTSKVKSSVQRGIRASVLEQYPMLEDDIDNILPKKEPMSLSKCDSKISLVVMRDCPLFFQERDGPFFPTLRLLHRYPHILPHFRVDTGAIRFVFQGANIMCPGLTSAGGNVPEGYEEGTLVAITAEDKESVLAVGTLVLSSADIVSINKGIAIEVAHHLNDGLWKMPTIS
eukprot:GCRY01003879.1.p1 GENE.GCRY01003879.1~~GCRY01003879.1.p1  ORF type:complete len:182 (-),score=25.66 GCRY01003879.1:202-747(-)